MTGHRRGRVRRGPQVYGHVDILQLVSDPARRGAQVHALALGRLLEARGMQVRNMAVQGDGVDSEFEVAGKGRVVALPSIRRACRSSGVVIAHGSTALPAAALASGSTPVIYRNIGDPRFWLATRSRRLRVKAYVRRVEHVVALWPGSAEYMMSELGVPPDRVTVIPNGVDVDRWPAPQEGEREAARRSLGLDPGEPVVAFVGALSPEKNVQLALDAVRRIPDARLIICGDGPDKGVVDAAISTGQRVTHLAPRAEVRPVYLAANVLLLTSLSEGMPGVIVEAGLCERPSVARPVGAVGEMVFDGQSGVLVDDDPEAIAAGLSRALGDAARLGGAARQHGLEHYDLGRLVDRWQDVITPLVMRSH